MNYEDIKMGSYYRGRSNSATDAVLYVKKGKRCKNREYILVSVLNLCNNEFYSGVLVPYYCIEREANPNEIKLHMLTAIDKPKEADWEKYDFKVAAS